MSNLNHDFFWLPNNIPVLSEADVNLHNPKEKAALFHAVDSNSTELEILSWLYATIRAFKPNQILETGSWNGIGTLALAHACKMNNFGKVTTLEMSSQQCDLVSQKLEELGLQDFVDIQNKNSLIYLKESDKRFDMCFFDSEMSIKTEELQVLLDKGLAPQMAVFHDTSSNKPEEIVTWTEQNKYRADVLQFTRHPKSTGYVELPLSRGMIAIYFEGTKK